MPVFSHIPIELNEELIWRGQGRRTDQIRPVLRELAQMALNEAIPRLAPRGAYVWVNVADFTPGRLLLDDGRELHGEHVDRLAGAEKIALAACTIGPAVDEKIKELISTDLALAAMLDTAGSTAVDNISFELCRRLSAEIKGTGLGMTRPFWPGDNAWPLADQQIILDLLPANELRMSVSEENILFPHKSLTMIFAAGSDLLNLASSCAACPACYRCGHSSV